MNLHNLDLEFVLESLLPKARARKLLVPFVGSAISIMHPAGLPTVRQFYELLFSELVIHARDSSEFREAFAFINSYIPFERFLQSLHDVLLSGAPDFIPGLIQKIYSRGEPNRNHRHLAQRLMDGRIDLVLTTNFDELIERSIGGIRSVVTEEEFDSLLKELTNENIKVPTVAHLHGSIQNQESLVALMNQVGKPIEGIRQNVLDYVLSNSTIVFIGYSESDQDISPIIREHRDSDLWRLVRPDKPEEVRQLPVELDPDHSRPIQTRDVLNYELNRLMSTADPKGYRLLGALYYLTSGIGLHAVKYLRTALEERWDDSTALAYANALASQSFFHQAADLLGQSPSNSSPVWGKWIHDRALFIRHTGRFAQAVGEYVHLREFLETKLQASTDKQLIPDLINASLDEIEVSVLLASSKPAAARDKILSHCEELLQKCRGWISESKQIPPLYGINYFEAELALLRGDPEVALEKYTNYQREAKYWIGPNANVFIELRKAVALSAMKEHKMAFRVWFSGIRESWNVRTFLAIVQYLVANPVLVGVSPSWYWLTRRTAAKLYPLYGTAKLIWLKITNWRFELTPKRRSAANAKPRRPSV